MKKTLLMTMAAAMTVTTAASPAVLAAERAAEAVGKKVTICMAERPDQATDKAQMVASKLFRSIGVTLDWHAGARFCEAHPVQALVISYSHRTPKDKLPGALANALPFEGTHIEIFYDRMLGAEGIVRVEYLGHVLAHEITHMLQYTARHSNSGLMKAHWDAPELAQMKDRGLGFAKLDVDLIYAGLARRAAGASVVAANRIE